MQKYLKNIILAFSFTPQRFSSKYELGVASVDKRINYLKTLLKPEDTGHIHTTISVLEQRVEEIHKELEKDR